jgi:hypothetical protein
MRRRHSSHFLAVGKILAESICSLPPPTRRAGDPQVRYSCERILFETVIDEVRLLAASASCSVGLAQITWGSSPHACFLGRRDFTGGHLSASRIRGEVLSTRSEFPAGDGYQ